ncbi:CoA pyrophosphatase [Rhodobacteraceae bacterium NNCM2]|nr:CoA pyrophosphatase [Coraliihabitans acroporae]
MITLDKIDAALALGPLGERSDFDLTPKAREHVLAGRVPRLAAVLCGLVERRDGLYVVLTKRAEHLKQHAGQISFPGGKIDEGDHSAEFAALREAEEEVGLTPADVRVMGTLDDYLTGTAFRVTPFVGMIDPYWTPTPDQNEVAEVFEVPLDYLMDPANRLRHHYDRDTGRRFFYAMQWGDYYIWGATAGMLKGLSDRLALLE